MKQTTKSIVVAVFIVASTIMLSGCALTDWAGKKAGEKIMEKTIESQTGGKVDVNSDSGTMNINSDKGSLSAGKEAKIPDNFPKDIFIYPDAKVMFAMSGTSGDKSFSVAYNTATSPEDAFSKYKEEMVKNGWENKNELDMETQGKVLNFKKDNLSAGVTMGTSQNPESAGKTTITISGGENNLPPAPAGGDLPAPGDSNKSL
jgi:hypothetical protein